MKNLGYTFLLLGIILGIILLYFQRTNGVLISKDLDLLVILSNFIFVIIGIIFLRKANK